MNNQGDSSDAGVRGKELNSPINLARIIKTIKIINFISLSRVLEDSYIIADSNPVDNRKPIENTILSVFEPDQTKTNENKPNHENRRDRYDSWRVFGVRA